jgi:hypothetical protein
MNLRKKPVLCERNFEEIYTELEGSEARSEARIVGSNLTQGMDV